MAKKRSGQLLYQLGFDEEGEQIKPLDVTPRGLSELKFPQLERRQDQENLGRFIREASLSIQVTAPYYAAEYLVEHVFVPFELFDQEEAWVLLLNTKNVITHEALVYRGSVNMSYIRAAEVFKPAVKVNATAVIFSHNHPSGDPSPSPEDIQVTRSLLDAGKMLGVELLDHIVVGQNRWVSLRDQDGHLGIWGNSI